MNPGQSSVSQVPMTALNAINTDIEIAPWSFAGKSGRVMSTDHYLIHSNIRFEQVMDRLPILLEHAIFRYQTAFRHPAQTQVHLGHLCAWRPQPMVGKTRQVLPQQAESLASIGRGGFAVNGTGYLYYIDWAGRDRDTFAIAVHEGWHQYVQSTFREDIPSWLDEGIATYMEGCDSDRPTTIQPFGLGTTGNAGGDSEIPHAQVDSFLWRICWTAPSSRSSEVAATKNCSATTPRSGPWPCCLLIRTGLIEMALNKCCKTPPTVDSAGK